MNKTNILLTKITIGEPISVHALTHTHTQTWTTRDGAFAGSTRAFHEAEAASQNLQRTMKEIEEKSSVPVR